MILYAHKGFTATINKMDEDFKLETISGTRYGFAGEYVATDLNGNQFIVSQEELEKYYVPVQKASQQQTKQLSPFEEQHRKLMYENMAKGYQEMGDINLEEANASVHTYNDGLEELEQDEEVISIINKIY